VRLLPQRLLPRVAVALGCAFVALWLLRAVLDRPAAAPARAAAAEPAAPPAHGALLATLAGRAERVVLAAELADVPARAAPVVVIAAGGAVRIHRRPPPPAVPGAPWEQAAVVLPAVSLPDLAPAERGALADVLAALAGRGPLRREAISGAGLAADPAQLDQLLRWVR
jgi:hypothetical protein